MAKKDPVLYPLAKVGDPIKPMGMSKRLAQAVTVLLTGTFFAPENPPEASQPDTTGRRFDYASAVNLYIQPRRDTGVTFDTLRNFAQYYDILRLVIETRKDQIEAIEWKFTPKGLGNKKAKPSDAQQKQVDQATAFFKNPDGHKTWENWLRCILEDLLVLDGACLWPVYQGTKLVRLELVDAATIKKVIDYSGRTPAAPLPAYQQILHGVVANNYTAQELYYYIRNPATNRIYGFSPVEQVLMTVNIALRREMSQLQYFTEGNVPEAIAGVPDEWTGEQIQQFQDWFDAMLAGDTAARRHLKFIPGDASKIQFSKSIEATLKTDFDEWLVRIICYCMNVPVEPFIRQVNRGTGETSKESASETGNVPLLKFLKNIIDAIVQGPMGLPDVEFKWNTAEDLDPKTQNEIDVSDIQNGVISIDVVREKRGLDPLGVPEMIFTTAGPVPVSMFIDGSAPNLQPPPAPGGEGGTSSTTKKPPAKKKEGDAGTVVPFRGGGQ